MTRENAITSLVSSEAKDPPPKIWIDDFDKLLAEVLRSGSFPLQYYNRFEVKKPLVPLLQAFCVQQFFGGYLDRLMPGSVLLDDFQ